MPAWLPIFLGGGPSGDDVTLDMSVHDVGSKFEVCACRICFAEGAARSDGHGGCREADDISGRKRCVLVRPRCAGGRIEWPAAPEAATSGGGDPEQAKRRAASHPSVFRHCRYVPELGFMAQCRNTWPLLSLATPSACSSIKHPCLEAAPSPTHRGPYHGSVAAPLASTRGTAGAAAERRARTPRDHIVSATGSPAQLRSSYLSRRSP